VARTHREKAKVAPDDRGVRAAELRELIDYHNERYHALDAPEIPDADYDALVREFEAESRPNTPSSSPPTRPPNDGALRPSGSLTR